MALGIDNTRVNERVGDVYADGVIEVDTTVKGGSAIFNGAISGGAKGIAGGWFADALCAGVAGCTQLTNGSGVGVGGGAATLPTCPDHGLVGSPNEVTGSLWLIFTVGTLKYCIPAWCASG